MFTRHYHKQSEADFAESTIDEFAKTDKMPLQAMSEPTTDFQDSVIYEELDADTVPASIMEELHASANAPIEVKATPKKTETVFDEFYDPSVDLKRGSTMIEEINSAEDLFKKYFKD